MVRDGGGWGRDGPTGIAAFDGTSAGSLSLMAVVPALSVTLSVVPALSVTLSVVPALSVISASSLSHTQIETPARC